MNGFRGNRTIRQAPPRAGDAPIVAVLDRGLVYRERVYIPLWATILGAITGMVWRLTVRVIRLAVRYPYPTAALTAGIAAYVWAGWLAVTGLVMTVGLLALVWAYRWPASWNRLVIVRVRSWWRFKRVYGPAWRGLMDGCGLLEVMDHTEAMPQIIDLTSYPWHDELVITLAAGQIPDDVITSTEALAHGLRAWHATARVLSSGRLGLLVLWADPLAAVVHPTSHPTLDPTAITADVVVRELSRVPVGVTESGRPWVLPLLGHHVLAAGTTGAGKSGLVWAIVWHLTPLIRAGWVTITALDPKYIELAALATTGLGVVHTDVPAMPAALEALVAEMDARCAEMTTRVHTPSLAQPVRIVVVDELATLTALSDNKSKARVETALGHLLSRGRAAGYVVILTTVEPTKEVVRWRGLCTIRICYRTDDNHADLVLAEGAHDRGARTEDIHLDTPGIAYTRIEGRRDITRVRTTHITDHHLATLTTPPAERVTVPAEPGESTAPDTAEIPVITLPTHTHGTATDASRDETNWSAS